MNTDFACPRCGGQIPNSRTPGAYPGAMSRADNATEVCSACGYDEAMRAFSGKGVQPVDEWPVTRAHTIAIGTTEDEDRNVFARLSHPGNPGQVIILTAPASAIIDTARGYDVVPSPMEDIVVVFPEDAIEVIGVAEITRIAAAVGDEFWANPD